MAANHRQAYEPALVGRRRCLRPVETSTASHTATLERPKTSGVMTFGKPVVFAVDDYLPITGSLDRAGTTQLVDAKVLANTIVQ